MSPYSFVVAEGEPSSSFQIFRRWPTGEKLSDWFQNPRSSAPRGSLPNGLSGRRATTLLDQLSFACEEAGASTSFDKSRSPLGRRVGSAAVKASDSSFLHPTRVVR